MKAKHGVWDKGQNEFKWPKFFKRTNIKSSKLSPQPKEGTQMRCCTTKLANIIWCTIYLNNIYVYMHFNFPKSFNPEIFSPKTWGVNWHPWANVGPSRMAPKNKYSLYQHIFLPRKLILVKVSIVLLWVYTLKIASSKTY